MRVTLALGVLLLGSTAVAEAQEGDSRVRRPVASEIRGAISVRGCVPDVSDLDLRALSLELVTVQPTAVVLERRFRTVTARVSTTSDPHTFSFVIGGLQPATLYALSIFTPPSPICGRVFWRHDTLGFVVSGGAPVLIEGVAATTSIEVRQPGTETWVGVDALDFTDSLAATRDLRWRSLVPGVVAGELQISTARFPTNGEFGACDETADAVMYRQDVRGATGEWTEVGPIDFNSILERRLRDGSDFANSTLKRLLVGAPLYVRIVPSTTNGPACDARAQGVPGWVMFAKVPAGKPLETEPEPPPDGRILEPGNRHHYGPPAFFHALADQPHVIHPGYNDWGYRVVRDHPLPSVEACSLETTLLLRKFGVPDDKIPSSADPFGCILANDGHTGVLTPGFRFVMRRSYSSGGGNAIEQTFNLVTAGVNAIGVGASAFANAYNAAADAMTDLAYAFVLATPGIGDVCQNPKYEEKCRRGVEMGMTYGMAAMGLPPSVPNWDELKEESANYLASLAAEELEATGVPSEFSEPALKELARRVIDDLTAKRGNDSPRTGWFVRDIGYTPASWTASIRKSVPEPLTLDVSFVSYQSPLYLAKQVRLPRKFTSLRVPIVLPESLEDIPAPVCLSSPFITPRMQCLPNLFAGPDTKPLCRFQINTIGKTSPWRTDEDCSGYSDLVGIYYRDALAAKIVQTPCTLLAGATLADFGFILLPTPQHTFVMGAAVPPMSGGFWNGKFINACK